MNLFQLPIQNSSSSLAGCKSTTYFPMNKTFLQNKYKVFCNGPYQPDSTEVRKQGNNKLLQF